MLVLSVFLFSFGALLTFFGAFKIGQSHVKVSLDEVAQKLFSEEAQKFMEKHSTQEKFVVSIDDKIEELFNNKLKEIEEKSTNIKKCYHKFSIQREGTILIGDRVSARYYDMKCDHCGEMKRQKFSADD